MAEADHQLQSVDANRPADALALLLAAVLFAIGWYFVFERDYLAAVLRSDLNQLPPADRAFIAWASVSKSLLLLLPVLLIAIALRWRGWSLRWTAGGLIAVGSMLFGLHWLDMFAYRQFGRHLLDLTQFAAEGDAGQAIGGYGRWILPWARASLTAMLIWLPALLIAIPLCRRLMRGRQWWRRPVVRVPLLILALALLLSPHAMQQASLGNQLYVDLYRTMPMDMRLIRNEPLPEKISDPVLRQLALEFDYSYRQRFDRLYHAQPIDEQLSVEADDPPHVVLIVIESWRPDVLQRGWMPKLARWAERGWVLANHYTGSYCSEAGWFALLYGRSPMTYNATVFGNVRPQLPVALQNSGYTTAYFSGWAEDWRGMEFMLGRPHFDHVKLQAEGDWPQWDRRALDGVIGQIAEGEAAGRPTFNAAFLISPHFEYRYPPRYEVHTPVSVPLKWRQVIPSMGDPEHRTTLVNRYRNCMLFMDDLLDEFLSRVDLTNTIVIITGDHGEALDDGGPMGHATAFSDLAAKTPMLILGPGFQPRRIQKRTLHVDLLPTMLHAIAGKPVDVERTNGVDLLQDIPARPFLLLTYNRNRVDNDACLLGPTHRVTMKMRMDRPEMKVHQFEDSLARWLRDHGLPPEKAADWVHAFADQLDQTIHGEGPAPADRQ